MNFVVLQFYFLHNNTERTVQSKRGTVALQTVKEIHHRGIGNQLASWSPQAKTSVLKSLFYQDALL